MPETPIFNAFLQFLDDDIVSLTALIAMADPECRKCRPSSYTFVTQLTLSLYLMTQCQLKLHCPSASVSQTLGYIIDSQRRYPAKAVIDRLTLQLSRSKCLMFIRDSS